MKMEARKREIGNQDALWVQKGDRKNKDWGEIKSKVEKRAE